MFRRSILERSAVFEEKRFAGSLGYDYENDGRGLMISATTSSSAAAVASYGWSFASAQAGG